LEIEAILNLIGDEYVSARSKYSKFHSSHEGFAVIKEEVDELWELVKQNKGIYSSPKMQKECIQIAAMALAFILDLTKENK